MRTLERHRFKIYTVNDRLNFQGVRFRRINSLCGVYLIGRFICFIFFNKMFFLMKYYCHSLQSFCFVIFAMFTPKWYISRILTAILKSVIVCHSSLIDYFYSRNKFAMVGVVYGRTLVTKFIVKNKFRRYFFDHWGVIDNIVSLEQLPWNKLVCSSNPEGVFNNKVFHDELNLLKINPLMPVSNRRSYLPRQNFS